MFSSWTAQLLQCPAGDLMQAAAGMDFWRALACSHTHLEVSFQCRKVLQTLGCGSLAGTDTGLILPSPRPTAAESVPQEARIHQQLQHALLRQAAQLQHLPVTSTPLPERKHRASAGT